MIHLNWENEQTQIALPEQLLVHLQALTDIIEQSEMLDAGEVSLLFVDDEQIRELNAQFRAMDKPTDVLSFAIQEEHDEEPEIVFAYDEIVDVPNLYGDIVISVERAQAQASEYGHSLLRELCFLYVHGFLHLIGYDHVEEAEEKVMVARQNEFLAKAGIER